MTKISIIDLSNDLGFTQASYFTKTFKKWTGLTPSEYRTKNKNVKQVYTIPRTASWMNNESVFNVSKEYFHKQHLPIKTRKVKSENYILSINGFEDNPNKESGWIYTVDCSSPPISSNQLSVQDKSVIQWLYVSGN